MLVYTVLKMQTNRHQTEKVENTTFKATIPKKKKKEISFKCFYEYTW